MQKSLDQLIEVFSQGTPAAEDYADLAAVMNDPRAKALMAQAQASEVAKSFDTNEPASAVTGGKADTKEGVTDDMAGNRGTPPHDGTDADFDENESAEAVAGGKAKKKPGVTDAPEGNTGKVQKSVGLPEPSALEDQLTARPDLQESYDAVEPLQIVAEAFQGITKSLAAVVANQVAISSRLDALDARQAELVQKSLAAPAPPVAAAPVAVPATVMPPANGNGNGNGTAVAATASPTVNPLQMAVAKSLQQLRDEIAKSRSETAELREAFANQPVSPHPAGVSKGLSPNIPTLSKGLLIETVKKGVETKVISPEVGSSITRMSDYADQDELGALVTARAPALLPLLGMTQG